MDDSQLKLNNQICFPIYSASKLITKAYKTYLDQFGLTYPQYLVLLVLWETDEITINQITDKLLLDTNTLSPMLKRMENMDFLQRRKSKEDERSVIIKLTTKGKELKKQAATIPEKLRDSFSSEDINQEEVIQLKHTMDTLVNLLSEKNRKHNK